MWTIQHPAQAMWMESSNHEVLRGWNVENSEFQAEVTKIKLNAKRAVDEFNNKWVNGWFSEWDALGSALASVHLWSITKNPVQYQWNRVSPGDIVV